MHVVVRVQEKTHLHFYSVMHKAKAPTYANHGQQPNHARAIGHKREAKHVQSENKTS